MDYPTLHDLVIKAASQHPRNRAVIFDDGESVTVMSYDKMQELSESIRKTLCCAGCSDGEMVGLYYESSVMLPSFILGTLQVNASFAPVDPRAPFHINEYFISTLNLQWLLIPKSLEKAFFEMYGQTFRVQPTDLGIFNDLGIQLVKLSTKCKPDNQSQSGGVHLAYAMHTSGTTGKPKIVRVPHQCIVPNVTHLSAIFSITSDDVIFMASPLTFDPSIVEMFLALSNGASLLMVPDEIKVMPRRLNDVLTRNQVTILQATPTLINRFGSKLLQQSLLSPTTHLRVLAFGGENCPTVAQINNLRAADNCITKFYNIYGITEVSSWASCYQIDIQDSTRESTDSIPLGEPLLETTLEVRKENGQTILEGEGELFIGSDIRVCLMDGETWPVAKKAVKRASGDKVSITDRGLIFIGRYSDQVKRNGKRFSLSQVKQIVESLQPVKSCKLLLKSNNRLVLFSILNQTDCHDSSFIPIEETLQGLMKDALPSYCLPDEIYILDAFPLTLHGKVDSESLSRHAAEIEMHEKVFQDYTKEERMQRRNLVTLWKKASSSTVEPLDTSLFVQHSSGDSFQAVLLVNAVESWTGRSLPSLLDVILHLPFAHVLQHIQSHCMEKNDIHTGRTSLNNTTLSSDSGLIPVTTKCTEHVKDKQLHIASRHGRNEKPGDLVLSLKNKNRDTDSSSIFSTSLQRHQPVNLDVKLESEYQEFSKRRKILVHAEVDQPEQIVDGTTGKGETKGMQSLSDLCTESAKIPKQKIAQTELSIPSAVMHCSRMKNCHEISTIPCYLCYPSTVQNYKPLNQVSDFKHDTLKDKTCFMYTVQRCSQLMATCQKGTQSKDLTSLPHSHYPERKKVVDSVNNTNYDCQYQRLRLCQRWRYDTGKCVDASPLLVTNSRSETVIYIGSHSHQFAAVSMATGKALWVTELGDRVESSACLSTSGRKVVVGCYDGCVYTLDADSGTIVWKFQSNGPIKSSPAADHCSSLVYVGSHDQHLYALDVEEQSCKWHLHCGGASVFSSPNIHYSTGTVYVATLAGMLLAVDKETGLKRWNFNCGKPVFSSPVSAQDGVLLGCVDGNLYYVTHSGKELWRFTSGAPIYSSPCVPCFAQASVPPNILHHSTGLSEAESFVVFGSHDHHIYCLSFPKGELCWHYKMSSTIFASPFIFKSSDCQFISQHCHTSLEKLRVKDCCAVSCLNRKSYKTGQMQEDAQHSAYHCASCHSCQDSKVTQDKLFVVVCSTEGVVVILDLMSGELASSWHLPGGIFSSPVVCRKNLVVGCRDDHVYCLEYDDS